MSGYNPQDQTRLHPAGTRPDRRAALQARIARRQRRRALWLAHDQENRLAPRPARTASAAWTTGFLFFGLIMLMYAGQGGPLEGTMTRDELNLGSLGMGLAVAMFTAGAIAIWRWRGRHPPQTMIYEREILSTGQPVSAWDSRGTWVAKDYVLWLALIFVSLPLGMVMLPYYTIAGLASPFVVYERMHRHYRERKAI